MEQLKQIPEYLKGKKTISIPLLQKEFGLNYKAAREATVRLLNMGIVEFDTGIEYKIVSERLDYLLEYKKYLDNNLKIKELMEAREALERHKAKLLARIQAEIDESSDDEDESEYEDDEYIFDDDDSEDDDIQIALEEAGIDLDDLIKVIELGQKVTRTGNSFTVSVIIRGLGCSFSRAARLLDFMRDRGYAVCTTHNWTQYTINISDEELQKLKNLKDKD